jgi:hypothetical protein
MVNRVATYPFTNTLIAENMRLQVKYADINTQISSGLKSQDYKGIARDSQYLLAVESSADKLEAYNANAILLFRKSTPCTPRWRGCRILPTAFCMTSPHPSVGI